jgi:hypothetical protein
LKDTCRSATATAAAAAAAAEQPQLYATHSKEPTINLLESLWCCDCLMTNAGLLLMQTLASSVCAAITTDYNSCQQARRAASQLNPLSTLKPAS